MKILSKLPLAKILRIITLILFVGALIGGVFWDTPTETFITWLVALVISILFLAIAEILDALNRIAPDNAEGQTSDLYNQIEQIAVLHQKGLISDAEYEQKKREYLSKL